MSFSDPHIGNLYLFQIILIIMQPTDHLTNQLTNKIKIYVDKFGHLGGFFIGLTLLPALL